MLADLYQTKYPNENPYVNGIPPENMESFADHVTGNKADIIDNDSVRGNSYNVMMEYDAGDSMHVVNVTGISGDQVNFYDFQSGQDRSIDISEVSRFMRINP